MLMGNTLTKYAEIGAATIPPRLKAITANQLIWVIPKKMMKLKAADDVTKNSLAETVPIAYRGWIFLLESRSGVSDDLIV